MLRVGMRGCQERRSGVDFQGAFSQGEAKRTSKTTEGCVNSRGGRAVAFAGRTCRGTVVAVAKQKVKWSLGRERKRRWRLQTIAKVERENRQTKKKTGKVVPNIDTYQSVVDICRKYTGRQRLGRTQGR